MGIKRAIILSDYIFFNSRIKWNVQNEVQTSLAVAGAAVRVNDLTGWVGDFIFKARGDTVKSASPCCGGLNGNVLHGEGHNPDFFFYYYYWEALAYTGEKKTATHVGEPATRQFFLTNSSSCFQAVNCSCTVGPWAIKLTRERQFMFMRSKPRI